MKLNNVVDKLIREGIPDGNKAIEDSMRRSLPFEEQTSDLEMSPALPPTDEIGGFKVRPGNYLQNGAMEVPGGVNFTIYSSQATSCELVLYHRKAAKPFGVIPIPSSYRIGQVWSIIVFGLNVENLSTRTALTDRMIPDGDFFSIKRKSFWTRTPRRW